MTVITVVVLSLAVFVAGIVGWYALWRRRVEAAVANASLERVPVAGGCSPDVLPREIALGGDDR